MLLRITEYCELACSHCFINASKKGSHMSMGVFTQAIACVQRSKPKMLLISGGEPTDHPNYLEMLNYALGNLPNTLITIITNGLWMSYPDKVQAYVANYPNVMFQVTNDKRYYNKLLDVAATEAIAKCYKNLVVCWEIGGHIYPQGRARKSMKITEDNTLTKGTRCFNLRSVLNKYRSHTLSEGIAVLESMMKFCQPSINIDGTLVGGESSECPKTTGNVSMGDKQLGDLMRGSSCNDCGMLNKLSPVHHAAVNYIHVTN